MSSVSEPATVAEAAELPRGGGRVSVEREGGDVVLSTARLKETVSSARIWQRGYYDRIVRNDAELDQLREYIHNNPLARLVENYEKRR